MKYQTVVVLVLCALLSLAMSESEDEFVNDEGMPMIQEKTGTIIYYLKT
jgi:hypothetical protein